MLAPWPVLNSEGAHEVGSVTRPRDLDPHATIPEVSSPAGQPSEAIGFGGSQICPPAAPGCLCRARASSMTFEPPRPWRIVVTDDDPQLMAFLVGTLRDAGHCVFAAYDGNSAGELALLIPDLDLLVTNTRWGLVSNRELIRSVRSNRPELPILHIGDPMPNPDGLLDDVPALREPFTPDQLLEKVRELVAKQWAPPGT